MGEPKGLWKKGRGKLGVLDPLLGEWQAEVDSPQSRFRCVRKFSRILGGKYVLLEARWEVPGNPYEEHAVYGIDDSGRVHFWSFTSDGKRSEGQLANVSDIHPEAVGFEAQMPAGLARMAYWPAEDGGMYWVVESKGKKGWNRFVQHHYRRL
ncbi:hypothetical protein HRbin33_01650 [bacterium HR33]|nr:hypothetical protein HRbin33_01650 [bacterium HR33]